MLVALVGLTGCGASQSTVTPSPQPSPTATEAISISTPAPTPAAVSSSPLPARLALAIPATPQDPELMIQTLQKVFEKWALAGYLQDSPETLAGFYNLLILSKLEPVETLQSWLAEAKVQANEQETTRLAVLEAELTEGVQPLTLEESFFYLWHHAYNEPDSSPDKTATIAGVRLALILAIGDENMEREIVRAWRQLTE